MRLHRGSVSQASGSVQNLISRFFDSARAAIFFPKEDVCTSASHRLKCDIVAAVHQPPHMSLLRFVSPQSSSKQCLAQSLYSSPLSSVMPTDFESGPILSQRFVTPRVKRGSKRERRVVRARRKVGHEGRTKKCLVLKINAHGPYFW